MTKKQEYIDQFLNHIKLHMDYLIGEKTYSTEDKIESMVYYILDTIDNCSGFDGIINMKINGEELTDDDFLQEEFFKINNEEYNNEFDEDEEI